MVLECSGVYQRASTFWSITQSLLGAYQASISHMKEDSNTFHMAPNSQKFTSQILIFWPNSYSYSSMPRTYYPGRVVEHPKTMYGIYWIIFWQFIWNSFVYVSNLENGVIWWNIWEVNASQVVDTRPRGAGPVGGAYEHPHAVHADEGDEAKASGAKEEASISYGHGQGEHAHPDGALQQVHDALQARDGVLRLAL